MRKAVMFQIRVCYRTVWDHPFLVGMLCFLAFLYRSFPFAFSLLISVSPVLVCTALLLGTLLSYGQPSIPQVERDEKPTDSIVPLNTGLSQGVTHVVERDTGKERDKVDQSTDKSSLAVNKLSEVHTGQRFGDHSRLVNGVSGVVAREFYEKKDEKSEEKTSDGELMENRYLKLDDESIEFENDKSVDSFDSQRVNLDSPPGSPWKQKEVYNEALYSGSDGAESSSPDASIADIMPMLDELHPLLDEDAPQPVSFSQDVSHAASESNSSKSTESDNDSDDGSEDEEELETTDDENEDGEDEEGEEIRDKEDPKSAITWTEEDQKNLMDLGSSELERNQRLESLIARRRARKNMSVIDEKNLIDLLSSDLPLNSIPPISTTRNNPFDLPGDSYDLGLPPIPGSAPSVLLPRRNPFDIPYDSSEEKPDLTGDAFQQEVITSQPKEQSFFRRHESFSVGPSIFGLNKQDKKDIRFFRPYFVPDPMASEATDSYSPFQSQPSDLSDSKVSSVLETESQGSIEDLEDKNLSDEDVEGKNLNEPELISKIEHASEDVGHGSQSSEEVECLVLGAADKRDNDSDDTDIKLQNVDNHHEVGPINPSKIFPKSETSEQKHSSHSSSSSSSSSPSSSSSEVSERMFADKEVVRYSEEATSHVETFSEQPSPNGSDLNITTSSVDEVSHYEPIYDASPPSIRKNLSSSSIASEPLPESDTVLPPELVKRTISFIEREPADKQDIEKSIPADERIFSSVDSQQLQPREVVRETDEFVVTSASAPLVPMLDSQASIESKSSTKEADVSQVESIKKASAMESTKVSEIQKIPLNTNSPRSPESSEPSNAKVATEESSLKNGPIDGNVHAGESKGKGASSGFQNVETQSATKQVLENHIEQPNASSQQESETGPSKAGLSKDSGSSAKSEKSEADAGKVDDKVVKVDDKVVTEEDKPTTTEKSSVVTDKDEKGKSNNGSNSSSSDSKMDEDSENREREQNE